MKFEWEMIFATSFSNGEGQKTYRAKVSGGWIVRHYQWDIEFHQIQNSMVFVPDRGHMWEIDKE